MTRGLYESFSVRLGSLLKDLLHDVGVDTAQIEARAKDVESFAEKVKRPGKDYGDPMHQITDLVGIRVVTYYLEDVDRVGKLIRDEFEVDHENSGDKSQLLE